MTHPSGQRPHPAIRRDRWILWFLAGPVLWYLFFWVVYLIAEAACVSSLAFTRTAGIPTVSLITVVLTGTTALVVIWFMWRAFQERNRHSDQQPLIFAGGILGITFFVATLFVGLPALFFPPC